MRTWFGLRSPIKLAAAVVAVGLLLSTASGLVALRTEKNNERRLLTTQTRQAANVVASNITGIVDTLRGAVAVAAATNGDAAEFRRYIAAYVGDGHLFVSVSLHRTTSGGAVPLASAGVQPFQPPESAGGQNFIGKAPGSKSFLVASLSQASSQRVGYAVADAAVSPFVVYAERAVPANRRVPAESTPAFANLHFVTYLGVQRTASAVLTTDRSNTQLPLTGMTASEQIPFGDNVLTLVTSPSASLTGNLEKSLPWVFLVVGLLLTGALAMITGNLAGRRVAAETSSRTITALYDRLDALYAEQRSIAETLQQALLPQYDPVVTELDIATRYVAGARGVDIGGDWYSLVVLDEHRFAFVVGDVSGRGVSAATLMARIRFTLRAYLLEGHPPEVALSMCSRQVDITQDDHIATVLVGVGNRHSRRITIANAGHPRPLVLTDGVTTFAPAAVGPPLGVGETVYDATTFDMSAGSTLLAYTDGLVERRTEDLDVGLERLAGAVRRAEGPLEDVLTTVIKDVAADASEDDIAILAFRWLRADEDEAGTAGSVELSGAVRR